MAVKEKKTPEPTIQEIEAKRRADRLKAKAAREEAALKAPTNASSPELAFVQLQKLDERFGPGKGARKERAKLHDIAGRRKPPEKKRRSTRKAQAS